MTEPQTGLPLGGTNPPQFDGLRRDADLVTVGIGGNDAGLVGVAEECAQLGLTDPNGTACRDHYAPGGNDTVEARIEETRPRIDAVLAGIHERSPKARVAIVGYPNVLPIDGTNCYPMVPLSKDDVAYIDSLIRRINAMIEDEAASQRRALRRHLRRQHRPRRLQAAADPLVRGPRAHRARVPAAPERQGRGEHGALGPGGAAKPPPDPAASITRLGIRPRPVHRDRAAVIRFRSDADTSVEVMRQRRGNPARGRCASFAVPAGASMPGSTGSGFRAASSAVPAAGGSSSIRSGTGTRRAGTTGSSGGRRRLDPPGAASVGDRARRTRLRRGLALARPGEDRHSDDRRREGAERRRDSRPASRAATPPSASSPMTTLVIGSSAIDAASAGARTPVVSASWLNVIEM